MGEIRFGALLCICSSILLIPVRAPSEVIDFDSEKLFGPSTFAAAGPAQTLNIATSIGNVTLTGGVILTNTAFVPADQTSIYGTAGNTPGVIASPTLTNPLTITFPDNVEQKYVDAYTCPKCGRIQMVLDLDS